MNDKAKKVLSYVACALGGAFLGIALLGGLSYCSTNSAREKAETINTIDRVRHNEQITTPNGDYTGYKMYFSGGWGLGTPNNKTETHVYSINTSTWTPTEVYLNGMVTAGDHPYWSDSGVYTWQTFVDVVNQRYESTKSNQTNQVRLMHTWGSIDWNGTGTNNTYVEYWSFVAPSQTMKGFSFVYVTPSWTTYEGLKLNEFQQAFGYNTESQKVILTYEKTGYFLIDTTRSVVPGGGVYFQDVESYYMEKGYRDGYTDGETLGNSIGYSSGYSDGYDTGNSAGYSEGYEDGNQEGYDNGYQDGYDVGYASGFTDGADNSLLFTKIGANQTAWSRSDITWDDSTDTTSTMKCLDFKDGENNNYYVSLDDYTVGGGEVLINVYKNGTASNNLYATIGRGNYNRAYTEIEIIPSSYLEFDFAQVTTYYHNAIPNNWFMLSGTPANANGYEQGYQKGYRDGQLATPTGQATNNVFSLFTQAFNAVGGIFEMKIFGFLPLYWFFLTPIFIAIITLLLRMVKH